MNGHALLSPSGASRWLACPPSARLEQQFPDKAGEAAKEGTLAHELGETLIKLKSGKIGKPVYNKILKKLQADELYKPEMLGYCEEYATFVMEQFAEAQSHTKQAILFLEQKLDLTRYVPEGYGTSDAVIIADHTMEIVDLKYGKGVPVSTEQNRQMMLYALGALHEFDFAYDIDQVRMTIFQPRIDNTSTWQISAADLKAWATSELEPIAILAFEGQGEFKAGKHCQFCRAKSTCKANAEFQLELAKYDFRNEALLDDDEISDILSRAAEFKSWLKSVESHALHEAINNEKRWPGFKVVEGRSNRKYADPETVAATLVEKGFAEDELYKRELLGITAMTGLLTKPVFKQLVEPLLIKPTGKPALVPLGDKRPEMDTAEAARADFADEYEGD